MDFGTAQKDNRIARQKTWIPRAAFSSDGSSGPWMDQLTKPQKQLLTTFPFVYLPRALDPLVYPWITERSKKIMIRSLFRPRAFYVQDSSSPPMDSGTTEKDNRIARQQNFDPSRSAFIKSIEQSFAGSIYEAAKTIVDHVVIRLSSASAGSISLPMD